jgi:uncharacterized protein
LSGSVDLKIYSERYSLLLLSQKFTNYLELPGISNRRIMEFEWDENKNRINKLKHDIDFQIAKGVFEDKGRIKAEDNRIDYGETRWISIGKAFNLILVIVYTIRDAKIRIISARIASKKERDQYNKLK